MLIDLALDLSDIDWLHARKADWRDRFEQKSIYVTIQPVCVLKDDTNSASEKKRDS